MFTSTTGARCSKRNPYRWVDEHHPCWILDTSVTQWPEANVFLLPPLGVDFFGTGGRRRLSRLSYVVRMPCYWSILPVSFRGLQDQNSCSAMCRVNEMNYTHVYIKNDSSTSSCHSPSSWFLVNLVPRLMSPGLGGIVNSMNYQGQWYTRNIQLPVISESVGSSQ